MYNKFYNMAKFLFLYLLCLINLPIFAMLDKLYLLNIQRTPFSVDGDVVAAYNPEQHLSALAKTESLTKSIFVFPKIYYEQKDSEEAVLFINYVFEILQALPQEQNFTIYRESRSIYDYRKLCKALGKRSICTSCIEKKAKKEQKKIKQPAPSSPAESNGMSTNQAFAYGFICFSLGGSLVYFYNHFFKH
jgi:hypothetical protein